MSKRPRRLSFLSTLPSQHLWKTKYRSGPTAAAHTIVILGTQSVDVRVSMSVSDSVGVPGMARFSLEEGRIEIGLLLEAGRESLIAAIRWLHCRFY